MALSSVPAENCRHRENLFISLANEPVPKYPMKMMDFVCTVGFDYYFVLPLAFFDFLFTSFQIYFNK